MVATKRRGMSIARWEGRESRAIEEDRSLTGTWAMTVGARRGASTLVPRRCGLFETVVGVVARAPYTIRNVSISQ